LKDTHVPSCKDQAASEAILALEEVFTELSVKFPEKFGISLIEKIQS
jgi:hypothetical protein